MKIEKGRLQEYKDYTMPQVLFKQAELLGNRVAIRKKSLGRWERITWKDYLKFVERTSLGLLAMGLRRGEHVAIIMDNQPEWLFCELGAQALGAVTLNLFTSSVAHELAVLLNRFDAAMVFAQDQEQVDKLLEVRDQIPHVRKVFYIDPTGMFGYSDPWLMKYTELLEIGADLKSKDPKLFERELWKGRSDEVNVMIMTSGTTGIPKLAMLRHCNFFDMALKWVETAPIGVGDNWVSITPPAWIVDQMWGIGVSLLSGMVMNFVETQATLEEDFREIGPALTITSSRFWEDLASKIRVKMEDAGWVKKKVYTWGLKVGRTYIEKESRRERIPLWLKLLRWLMGFAAYRPLLDRTGCLHIRAAITGGHPISPDVIKFFRACGLNLKNAYGLTEVCGVFQVQPDGEVKPETVGKPLPRTQVKIGEDGEVMVSSPSLFAGYYKDEEATRKVIEDGWLHTGDAGVMDEDGHLVIIGRKEEITRLRSGEVLSPDFVETRLKFSPYIKEAVVFGEGRDYVTGLICIDFDNVGSWAEARMIPYTTYTDLSQNKEVEGLILGEVREVNQQLPSPMRVKKIILLYKALDPDDEELTRTGKVRRKFVAQLYSDLIEAMYEGKNELVTTGKVRYRDGHVDTVTTTVRILDVEEV